MNARVFALYYSHQRLAAGLLLLAFALLTIFGDDRGCSGGGGEKHWPRH